MINSTLVKVCTKAGTVMHVNVKEYAFVTIAEVKTRRTNGGLEHLVSVTRSKRRADTIEDVVADACAIALTCGSRALEMKKMDRVKRRAVARDINFAMLLACDFNKLYNVNQ